MRILTDEVATRDQLGRTRFVNALASVVVDCDTPFVVGVFGDWGTGKTTLLNLLRNRLERTGVRCVWFDSWLHQDDDNPAIALVQTMVHDLQMESDSRKLLTVIGMGLVSALLKTTTTVGIDDIQKIGERYEEERFLERDARIRLRERFAELIGKARGSTSDRLVFFIDDLDRCAPTTALALLESLRLYLNLKGCVFVIAADRQALQRAISVRHGQTESRYLDKIIQLPFTVPPLSGAANQQFVKRLLPKDLKMCADLLTGGLGSNPRSAKRFVNILTLNHRLAKRARIRAYSPGVLCFLLLLQFHDADRYQMFADDRALLDQWISEDYAETNPTLRRLRTAFPLPRGVDLEPYFVLANSASVDLADIDDFRGSEEFMRPVQPSEVLAAIVGHESVPRTEITKRLWEYIKSNGLQDKSDRRMINADAAMRLILDGREQVNLFELVKFVSRHLKELPVTA